MDWDKSLLDKLLSANAFVSHYFPLSIKIIAYDYSTEKGFRR